MLIGTSGHNDYASIYSRASPSSARIHQLQHLDQLILCGGWERHISSSSLLHDLNGMPSIKKLYIESPCAGLISLSINPAFSSALTHLSLKTMPVDTRSPYEIVLRYGVNIKSLQIEGPLVQQSSLYFRRYTHALPYLTEFGVTHYSVQHDADFFPAVCDFLRLKAGQLARLELRSTTNKYQPDRLGFNACWNMFQSPTDRTIEVTEAVSFPLLESLSITLPAGLKNLTLHYSNRIPESVTSLSLSGSQICGKAIRSLFRVVSFYSYDYYFLFLRTLMLMQPQTKKRIHKWPPNLHIISLDFGANRPGTINISEVQRVAWCIDTLRVLKFTNMSYKFSQYWSVCRDEAGNVARCELWNERETNVLVEETLDRFGCKDPSFR
jgi:hypothetical protein